MLIVKYTAYILSGLFIIILFAACKSSHQPPYSRFSDSQKSINNLDTKRCQLDYYTHSEVEFTPIFSPITFVISGDGISVEPNYEITTFIGTVALEPSIPILDFANAIEDACEPFTVVIQDNNRPSGQEVEVHHIFVNDVEVEMKVDNTLVSTILITKEGLWVNEAKNIPFIHYTDELVWVDVTDKNMILTLKEPDDYWPDVYRPWQYYKYAEIHDRNAGALIMAGLADLTTISAIFAPSWVAYHFGPGLGKIIKFMQIVAVGIITLKIVSKAWRDPIKVFKFIRGTLAVFLFFWIIVVLTGIVPDLLQFFP